MRLRSSSRRLKPIVKVVSKYYPKNYKSNVRKQHRLVNTKLNNNLTTTTAGLDTADLDAAGGLAAGGLLNSVTESENPMCGICFFCLNDNTPIIKSDRYHLFHIECLRNYLIVNPRGKCPLCRRIIWESAIQTLGIPQEEDLLYNFSQRWFYVQNFITKTIYKVHFTNDQKTGLYTNSLLDVEEYGENPWFLNVMEDGLRFKIVIKDGNDDIMGQRKLACDFLVQHASNVKWVSQFKHVVEPWSSTSANFEDNITTKKWLCNLISNVLSNFKIVK